MQYVVFTRLVRSSFQFQKSTAEFMCRSDFLFLLFVGERIKSETWLRGDSFCSRQEEIKWDRSFV